jgi:hypothetical protein
VADIKSKYGTSGQAITITLNNLAAGAGRESTVVDNGTNLFLDVLVEVTVTAGVVSGNQQILVYGYASVDGGTTYTELATGSDAAYTPRSPTTLVLLGSIPMPTNSLVYQSRPFSLAQAFGVVPQKWGIVVVSDNGAALAASGHSAQYQGVLAQN